MKIRIGLPNRPMKPSPNATHWPIIAAISVARTKPSRAERNARRMRPPSIGKAGIRLKSARNRFTDASRSTIETLALSTVASEPPSSVALVTRWIRRAANVLGRLGRASKDLLDPVVALVGWRRSGDSNQSPHEFPANREFYRELCDSAALRADFVARNRCAAATYRKIPYGN